MMAEKILVYNKDISEVVSDIKSYADKRSYHYNCVESETEYVMEIYDRKFESSSVLNMMDMFTGNYLLPERIKLTVKLLKNQDSIEINVKGDVVMNEVNVINDSPKKRDKYRCEDVLKNFTQYLKRVYEA